MQCMTRCPICTAPLERELSKKHIKACEMIEMGLLAEQLAPTVDAKPPGYKYLDEMLPGV